MDPEAIGSDPQHRGYKSQSHPFKHGDLIDSHGLATKDGSAGKSVAPLNNCKGTNADFDRTQKEHFPCHIATAPASNDVEMRLSP